MKRGRVVGFFVAVVAMFVTSCIVVDEFEPKQRTQIENYLQNGKKDYFVTSDSAFVVLEGNRLLAVGEPRPKGAEKDDRVEFNVEAYTFSSSPATYPYYTNKRYLAEQLSATLDTSYWDFEPYSIRLGHDEIINGLEEALVGSIVGDSILVFLTSSLAYGSAGMGAVPKNTAVMMILTVEDLEQ